MNYLGIPTKNFLEEELSDLMEEILTLDDDSLFDITCESIFYGKWQILGSILSEKEFSEKQIKEMKDTLEDYVEDLHDDENSVISHDSDVISHESDVISHDSDHVTEDEEIYRKMKALISRVEQSSRDPDRLIEKMRHKSRKGQCRR